MRPGLPFFAATLLLLAACHRDSGGAPSSRSSSSSAPSPAATSLAAPSASASTGATAAPTCEPSGPRACAPPAPDPGRYSAPAEDSAPAAPAKRTQLGGLDDWVRAYDGMGTPETKKPPRLGVLADVPKLAPSRLVYTRSGQIIRVDLPAGTETPLTKGPSSSRQPRWTKDGQHLFFVSNRENNRDEIYRMRADGTETTRITRGLPKVDRSSWTISPDGASLAYIAGSSTSETALHLFDTATHADDIVHRGIELDYPTFAQDGKTLFFVEGWFAMPRPGVSDPKMLHALNLGTREDRRLPNAGVSEISDLEELGDGRLLFVASVDFSMAGRAPHIFTMPAAGGAWTRVNELEALFGFLHLAPSPSRKKIAVGWSIREGGFEADWRSDVTVIPFGSGQGKPFTEAFPRPFYNAHDPSWAPDDRHLAFTLALCPYAGCELGMRSVVIADTDAPEPKLAFVGYGSAPVFAPAPP
ncbi:MAG: hypothetical protein U0359_18520 [Byssovorax sp.]